MNLEAIVDAFGAYAELLVYGLRGFGFPFGFVER